MGERRAALSQQITPRGHGDAICRSFSHWVMFFPQENLLQPRKGKKKKKRIDTNLVSVVYLACHSYSCLSGGSRHVFYSFWLLAPRRSQKQGQHCGLESIQWGENKPSECILPSLSTSQALAVMGALSVHGEKASSSGSHHSRPPAVQSPDLHSGEGE